MVPRDPEDTMRKLSVLLALVCTIGFAGDLDILVEDNSAAVTNSETAVRVDGYVNTIIFIGDTTWTGTVTLATSYETLFTATSISETNIYRPRVIVHDNIGNDMTGTNENEKVLLSQDAITATIISTSSATTNDVTIKVRLD